MRNIGLFLIALFFATNSSAQCAIATANNSYGVYCYASGGVDLEAVQNCEKSGGHNCTVIAHFSNSCWAIAKDQSLGVSAPAFGYATLNDAKVASIRKCLSAGGNNCVNTRNVGCEGSVQFAAPSQTSTSPAQSKPLATTNTID